jgi:hypothetical protein
MDMKEDDVILSITLLTTAAMGSRQRKCRESEPDVDGK